MNRTAPIVIVAGFLGAGKTSFLQDILPELEKCGLKPFVIINDYSNARVDASFLQKEGRPVTPINGNCICCDSLFELVDVLEKIEVTENRVVLLEANGTADPAVLIEHLLVKQELKDRFGPIVQVAIVDLQRWQQRHDHNDLERLQVETASHIQFTRIESSSSEHFSDVRSAIDRFNPKAQSLEPETFVLELEQLVKQSYASPTVNATDRQSTSDKVCDSHDKAEHQHEHHHEHEHGRHHLSHAYVGVELKLPNPIPANDLRKWLASLPGQVLRIKGLVRFSEEPERWYHFQCADGTRESFKLRELRQEPVLSPCAVLIGVKLDEKAIQESLTTSSTEEVSSAT